MKLALFILFCAGLFMVVQKALSTPLAYFAFFPFGFLLIFYLYSLRDWIFFFFLCVVLTVSYFFIGRGLPATDIVGLFASTVMCFGLLAYYQHIWENKLRQENQKRQMALEDLTDLQHKHSTRVESLYHLEKQVASLINLFEIARDFNECLDLKETVQILYKKVLPELPFDRAVLIVLKPDETPPSIVRTYLITKQGVEEKGLSLPEGEEVEWLDKALIQRTFISWDSTWLFPLILEGEFNALFIVQGAVKEDLAKFEVLSSQLALQVRKVRLYEIVRELSIIDGLTGVFVRRHFLERFEEEIKRALKHRFPLTVLMLDIDHFKRYNDEFGHLVGDATLKEVAQIIRANVRNVDIVARYGGEEFVVVIPETRQEGAVEVAERIRSAVARKAFRVYDEETKVTVSIGISIFPEDLPKASDSYDPSFLFELLQRADRALYRAKEEGRNRVILHRLLGEK